MAWVPLHQSSIAYTFSAWYEGGPTLENSTVVGGGRAGGWDLNTVNGDSIGFRVTVLNYYSPSTTKQSASTFRTNLGAYPNSIENTTYWEPNPVEAYGYYLMHEPPWEPDNDPSPESYEFFIEVWDDSEPPPSPSSGKSTSNYVYEMEKGWSFDGNFIPHFAVFNWYFGDNPVDYTSIQKIRVHGLSHGRAFLQVATTGIQQDGYDEELTEPQWLDLPRNPQLISESLEPKTNYADAANRGLAIQMMFSGRNQDITKPEPKHVLQVLVVQGSPPGTGFRSN